MTAYLGNRKHLCKKKRGKKKTVGGERNAITQAHRVSQSGDDDVAPL